MSGVAAFKGSFDAARAERLLWRAGFGPRKGEAEALAKLGLAGAVHALTYPDGERLVGPAPKDDKGRPLAPYDAWGHDHVWWLDRMVRTSRPLVERMTLVWHDWFATSDAGVDSQRLMLNQNQLLREHALGAFPELLAEVTKDPAMLLCLNGTDNSKCSPNENYGREMLELFTLGAGRGYTESDVRENARALTGFRNDWRRGVGSVNFRYDPNAHDTGTKTIFHQAGRFTWKDSVRLAVDASQSSLVLRPQALELLRPGACGRRDRTCARAPVRQQRSEDQAGRRCDPQAPRALRGPRMVKSPAVFNAGLLRRLGRGVDTTAYAWLGAMAGQRLFSPPNVGGWDDSRWLDTATWRGRWWIATYVLKPYALDPGKATQPFDAQALVDGALEFWNKPALGDATHAALLTFAQAALADAEADRVEAQAVRRDDAERAPAPDRRLTGDAGGMSDCNHCDGLSRSRLLHRAAAEAGRGLPAIEPGMPLPAGTGLSRRSFLTQSAGAMLAVYGSSKLGLRAFEEGIAAAATTPTQPVLVSVFLEGGADALSVLSPQGDPLYRKLRPKLALSGGTVFAEDDRLYWHPAAAALATLHAEQKLTVMPAVGYTNADQSHFTSRHYWEVGATSTTLRTGWLGRYLDRVGVADNPLQGLSLDDTLAPALATAKVPVASVDGPDQYDFWSNRVWGEVEQRMLAAIGSLGAQQSDAGPTRRRRRRRAGRTACARSSFPFQGQDGKPGFTSPVAYPTSDDAFPRRLAGLAAMLGAGCRSAASR